MVYDSVCRERVKVGEGWVVWSVVGIVGGKEPSAGVGEFSQCRAVISVAVRGTEPPFFRATPS